MVVIYYRIDFRYNGAWYPTDDTTPDKAKALQAFADFVRHPYMNDDQDAKITGVRLVEITEMVIDSWEAE